MDERATLSDETLDRELRAALDVAPSREFVARVRTRVAGEVPASRWPRWQWVAATGAATTAAAVLVTIGMLSTPEAPAPGRSERRAAAPVTRAAPVAAGRADDARSLPAEGARHSGPLVSERAPVPAAVVVEPARKFPEVLLSADEQRVIQMLVRMGRTSDTADAVREQALTPSSAPLPALDIQAIEI
jgi:hypothetical protein